MQILAWYPSWYHTKLLLSSTQELGSLLKALQSSMTGKVQNWSTIASRRPRIRTNLFSSTSILKCSTFIIHWSQCTLFYGLHSYSYLDMRSAFWIISLLTTAILLYVIPLRELGMQGMQLKIVRGAPHNQIQRKCFKVPGTMARYVHTLASQDDSLILAAQFSPTAGSSDHPNIPLFANITFNGMSSLACEPWSYSLILIFRLSSICILHFSGKHNGAGRELGHGILHWWTIHGHFC